MTAAANVWGQALVLLLVFQTLHTIFAIRRIGSEGLSSVLSGYAAIFCLAYVANHLAGPSALAMLVVDVLLLMGYGLLSAYFFSANGHLDYAVISENYTWASTLMALKVVWNALRWEPLGGAALMGLWLVLSRLLPGLAVPAAPVPLRGDLCALFACVYVFVLLSPCDSHDELMHFLKSLRRYHQAIAPYGMSLPTPSLAEDEYPFLRDSVPFHDLDLANGRPDRPCDVFLIMIESLNAAYVGQTSPEGHEYTPCLNRLADRGVYFERFYANGVQTVAGQTATLFSLLPGLRGNVFNNYRYLDLRSLASVLSEAGYETFFFQGDKHLDLENTRAMLNKHGFRRVERVWDYLEKGDLELVWGWGPEDGVVYRRFFQRLDVLREQQGQTRPVFGVISTINNHMPFDVPARRRRLYPAPSNPQERYANSLFLTDSHLPVFFEELARRSRLADSIVVVTGDHSFPTGAHGIAANEIGTFEESFRTPLLILWEGRLRPGRVAGSVHSQMDLAPTILDLLRIDPGLNAFQGESVFSPDPARPVFFTQPYAGVHVGMATVRHKYLRHLSSGREALFRLADDPYERRNLIDSADAAPEADFFRGHLPYFFLNQHLIERNRIWKGR